MTKIIKHQFLYAQPKEMVWEYLTNSELLEQWLMSNDFLPIVGHEFRFTTNPIPALDFDGIHYCKVLEVVPGETLSYTWNTGPGNGKITMESVVTWTLRQTEKGTEVTLEHRGFAKAENLAFYNGLLKGWVEKLEKINKLLNAVTNGDTEA
ncbi:SRPBCC family protein [Arachidicoccus soli]|uniref:SRPBCC domain-containing protein n=1 Tax=Arachidicoccus soli TaxID=2341117 RepID=A0A386HTS1_9BACT|nr:SRPBCC domain-containing protein [Arachidicoccus soli]AYD48891.1 SRPBCC domain-containing protein [Arachidicoccus soli]